MEILPKDILLEIGLLLKPYDLFNFLLTNKKIYKICDSKIYWRRKLEKEFSYEFMDFYKKGIPIENPKDLYIKNYNLTSQKKYNFINSFLDTFLENIKDFLKKEYRKQMFCTLSEIQESMIFLPLENVKRQMVYADIFLKKYLPYESQAAYRKVSFFVSEMHIDSFICNIRI